MPKKQTPHSQKTKLSRHRHKHRHVDALENEFHTVLKSIADGVVVINTDGEVILFNQTAEKITGYQSEEVEESSFEEIFHVQTEGRQKVSFDIHAVLQNGELTETADHIFLLKKDGSTVPITYSIAPIHHNGSKIRGAVITLRDVSREYEINRMKSEFVSIVSHQLRTPLSAIKWFLETLIENHQNDPISDRQRDYLEQAFQSNERMIILINDLLNVSRLESGRVRNDPTSIDVATIFRSVIQEMEIFAHANNVTIDCTFCEKTIPDVYVDPGKIRQVIQNLLSNGVKYTRGKETLRIEVEVRPKEIEFRIQDQGIGIPESDQQRLFEPFFRAENAIATQAEGSGLGLYICKMLLEFNGGRIWVESTVGKGSTFFFTLPRAN